MAPILTYAKLSSAGRVVALAALLPVVVVYNVGVWRVTQYVWNMGLHFYGSSVFTADTLWYGIHCVLLALGAFLWPHQAGLTLPRFGPARRVLALYAVVIGVTAAAAGINYQLHLFTNPFSGRGPFFFTLGPLAWEAMWPGLVYGFAARLLDTRAPGRIGRTVAVVLAVASVGWYIPILGWLSRLDAAFFIAMTLGINLFSLALRRRTASILPGLACHLLMKFILTW